MDRKEKERKLYKLCDCHYDCWDNCKGCPVLNNGNWTHVDETGCPDFELMTDEEVDIALELFGYNLGYSRKEDKTITFSYVSAELEKVKKEYERLVNISNEIRPNVVYLIEEADTEKILVEEGCFRDIESGVEEIKKLQNCTDKSYRLIKYYIDKLTEGTDSNESC